LPARSGCALQLIRVSPNAGLRRVNMDPVAEAPGHLRLASQTGVFRGPQTAGKRV